MKTKALQIEPGRCKKSLPVSEVTDTVTGYIAEEKFDGLRYLLQIRPNGTDINFLTSRRVSVVTKEFVEKQDKYTKIRDHVFPTRFNGTVLDGEVCAESGISCDAQRNANAENVRYHVWDVLFYKGVDMRSRPLSFRLNLLREVSFFFPPWMNVVKQFKSPAKVLRTILKNGGEGIILKNLEAAYGEDWIKVKAEETEDVIIYGYQATKSTDWKSKNWIGALLIGQWMLTLMTATAKRFSSDEVPKPGMVRLIRGRPFQFIDVGRCSGFDQEMRAEFSKNQEKYLGEVIEVEYQMRFPTGKFRSPRYVRLRKDKNAYECVWNVS